MRQAIAAPRRGPRSCQQRWLPRVKISGRDHTAEELAAKRADYFEAGTRVVWDVDPIAQCVRVYRPDAANRPVTFARGQTADAEPAVPDWRIAVDRIFA